MPGPFQDGLPENSLRNGGQCQKDIDSPVNMLVDTVTSIQKEMAILCEENRLLRTSATSQVVQVPQRVALRTTRVPRFDGTTSWEQYHQVFEAIVRSNGWDSDTAALQLFSHLEGDALNVAHLIPLTRRLSQSGLVDALTAHYGSPGRLADYMRQFEKTTRTVGEDPAIFTTALETLAVKAFGDMGRTAQLCLIRDRFMAGHGNCDLRRHLDSVAPETPSRDIVDRCRVWESHTDPASSRLTKPNNDRIYTSKPTVTLRLQGWRRSPDRIRILISWRTCFGGCSVFRNGQLRNRRYWRLRNYYRQRRRQRPPPKHRPFRRDWSDVMCFSCGKMGHAAIYYPDESFPFLQPG